MSGSQNPYDLHEELYSNSSQSAYTLEWFNDWQSQPQASTSQQLSAPTTAPAYHPTLNPSLSFPQSQSFNPSIQHYPGPHQAPFDPGISAFAHTPFFALDNNPAHSFPTFSDPFPPSQSSNREVLSPLNLERPLPTVIPILKANCLIDPRVLIDRLSQEVHDRICSFLEPREIVRWSKVRVRRFTSHSFSARL